RSQSESRGYAAAMLITGAAYVASAIYGFWISHRCNEDHAELLRRIRPLAERLYGEPSQTPTAESPPETEPIVDTRWIPIVGFAALGAEPFGSGEFPLSNFGTDATLGFEIAGRGGFERVFGRRLHLTADAKAYFARFGVAPYPSSTGGEELAFGFLV